MSATLISLTNALGWTLLHSLWQALIVLIILRLLLNLLRNTPARIRYNISYVALTGIFVWFLVTFYQQWHIESEQFTAIYNTTGTPVTDLFAASISAPLAHTNHSFSFLSLLPWLDVFYLTGLIVFVLKMLGDVRTLFQLRNSRKQPFDRA